jgi:gamma-glutamylcyclotransferase (GGCT)/AIG2-like uncharacterized protein YtfP
MNLLFVYGTLLQSDNPFGSYLKNNSRWLSAGKLRGCLYDIGEYPGAVINKDVDSYVFGHIFMLKNHEQAWIILDEYEGYGIGYASPNEFIRQLVEVETETHTFQCWTYLYNLSLNGLYCIKSGNYEGYISKK